MKNLKKILALAVAFVMCFTMFAGAAVFSDVTPGGDYSQAITFLSDLGVIAGKPDGSFGINDAITRADAACLIARLMTGQPNPSKNDGTVQFSDVQSGSYYETSVGYCVALGITVGTGNGQYSPLRTITDGEFIAMLTRALGYDTAEHPLAFPMGNITTAQARGLLYGVNVDYASDALRGEDAQMLYNAMFAEYDKAAANKNTFQASDEHWDVTIAEEVFGLGRLSHDTADADNSAIRGTNNVSFHGANRNNNPTIDCDAHSWVIAGVDARNAENTYIAFAIDDADVKAIDPEDHAWAYQEFTYDGDIKDLLGYRVELWGEYDHSGAPWDVAAIKVVDGNMTGSRAAASAFQSRYDANQAMYNYTPDMYTDTDQVVVDGKTLYINKNGNQVNTGKINLDINTAANWMWRTEVERIPDRVAVPGIAYTGFDNTFALEGPFTNNTDVYRLANVTAALGRNPLSNQTVNLNFADGDQYKLFDWDGDDYIDFVVVDTAKYAEVASKSSSRMVLEADDRNITASVANGTRTRGQYSLKLDDDNLKVEGADAIEEGDVVQITVVSRVYDRNDGEIVTIKLDKVEPQTKKLEKINVTRQEYTFDGEVIDLAEMDLFDVVELQQQGSQSMEELDTTENIGKEFDLWFDRNNFLIKARVKDDSAMGYLMILETDGGQDNLHTSTTVRRRDLAVADVLFDDNTVGKEVEFVKNLTIDGSSSANGYNSSTREWDEKKVVGNIYKYYMNDDDQITRLISLTDNQAANYNFDDSKDRLGVTTTGGTNRNYGFKDDAVVFAVTPVQSQIADGETTGTGLSLGYIRSTTVTGTATRPATIHYWVDPADVMAVAVDDVPEIDNRNNGNKANIVVSGRNIQDVNWTTPSSEVTHPARFVSWDRGATNNFVPKIANDGDRWIELVTDTNWNVSDYVYYNDTPVTNNSAVGTVPSAAYGLNRDGEIEAAILGVDSLSFFGASSIKLALISNVYAAGGKTYEFKAAIDGKYDTFKTISADEDEIFKGTIGDGTANSLSAMRTYLNENGDNWTGRRNALYAEVVMNSDGLIREVRAMRVVNPTAANTSYWGNDQVAKQFLEGNAYRVIRGVSTQLLSKNLVTWQASPTAASGNRLYQLSKYDDNNGYDHLEAFYDDDTKFYSIDQRVPMVENLDTLIGMGFSGDIDGDISVKDSGVMQESQFGTGNNAATYWFYDFAVYKNDMDRLAAVFAFEDDVTNTSSTVPAAGALTAADISGTANTRASDGTVDATPTVYDIIIDSVDGIQYAAAAGSEGNPIRFTVNNKAYAGAPITPGAAWTVNDAANAIARVIATGGALGADFAGLNIDTTVAGTVSGIRGVDVVRSTASDEPARVRITGTVNGSRYDRLVFDFEFGDNIRGRIDEREGSDETTTGRTAPASSRITVATGSYTVDSTVDNGTPEGVTFAYLTDYAAPANNIVVNLPDGTYNAAQIASMIREALGDALDGLARVELDGNNVVITDLTGIDSTVAAGINVRIDPNHDGAGNVFVNY